MKIVKNEKGETVLEASPKEAEAIVGFVAAATPILEEAEKAEKTAALREATVGKAIPAVVDTLAKAGYITNEQRIKAAESLKDPVKVLDTLQRIALSAAIKTAEEVKTLGSASTPKKDAAPTTKVASVASKTSAADEHFLRSFGL
jgi:hypothetical protein